MFIQGKAASKRDYDIRVLHPEFSGQLDIYLGPGTGTILIESAGPIVSQIRMLRDSTVKIETGTTINSALIVASNADIMIREDNLWASEILVQSNDQHGIVDLGTTRVTNSHRRKVVFEPHVWVARRVIILPDVTIGEGAIVGAAAVVTRDVPACCIAAGNPARIVKRNTSWSRSPRGLTAAETAILHKHLAHLATAPDPDETM